MFVWQSENSRIKILVQKPAKLRLEQENHWKNRSSRKSKQKRQIYCAPISENWVWVAFVQCKKSVTPLAIENQLRARRKKFANKFVLLLWFVNHFSWNREAKSVFSIKMMKPKVDSNDSKILKSLRDIVSSGSNRQCFDCGQKGVTYVNMTCGSFVCTTCSGILWVPTRPPSSNL